MELIIQKLGAIRVETVIAGPAAWSCGHQNLHVCVGRHNRQCCLIIRRQKQAPGTGHLPQPIAVVRLQWRISRTFKMMLFQYRPLI